MKPLLMAMAMVAFVLPGAVRAEVCADVAQEIRALRRDLPPDKWAGFEHERGVPDPIGMQDHGLGGVPGRYRQPILPSQKARLLREVKTRDPDHAGEWQNYLAANAAELNAHEAGYGAPAVYELKSARLFRMEQAGTATLLPYFVTYYYLDGAGRAHVVRGSAVPSDREEADYYGYFQALHFLGVNGVPIEIMRTDRGDDSHLLAVWIWSGTGFNHACDIETRYDFSFSPFARDGGRDHFEGDGERFLARHAADWAREFVRHRDALEGFYAPVRDAPRPVTKAAEARLDALRDAAEEKSEHADAAYQKRLMADFARHYPAQAGASRALAKAVTLPDQNARPVMTGGQVHVVVLRRPDNGNGPLPEVILDLYAMKAGKAERVASVDTARRDGNLIGLTTKYLTKPPGQ